MNNPTPTENRALIVELVEARKGDRMLVRIADRTDAEIYGTAIDVEPYLIEAPVLEVHDAVALAQEILQLTSNATLPTWKELFPHGRFIFYEGDEPQKFVEEIRTEFGFDPSADEQLWRESSHQFYCPPGILDAIYGSARWPMGS